LKVYGTVNILGDFWPQRTSAISEIAWTSDDEGRILFDSDNYDLYYGSSTEWVKLTNAEDLFPVGTTCVFASTLPTGWNLKTALDDKVIMLTSSTSQIGTLTGSWTISGLDTEGSHNHDLGGSASSSSIKSGTRTLIASPNHEHTLPNAGSHSHTFDGSWRPARVKFALGKYGG